MSRKRGDRRDGTLLRDIDSMHYIMPLMYPNRCDNEAFISEQIDLTNVMAYLKKKNDDDPAYRYNFFQVMVTAVLKTITLRPQLNRFIANYNLYQRNEVTAAFTIKKIFSDDGDEALAFLHSKPTDNIDSIHDEIYRQVSYVRHEGKDPSTKSMDALQKLPLFLKKAWARANVIKIRGVQPLRLHTSYYSLQMTVKLSVGIKINSPSRGEMVHIPLFETFLRMPNRQASFSPLVRQRDTRNKQPIFSVLLFEYPFCLA